MLLRIRPAKTLEQHMQRNWHGLRARSLAISQGLLAGVGSYVWAISFPVLKPYPNPSVRNSICHHYVFIHLAEVESKLLETVSIGCNN